MTLHRVPTFSSIVVFALMASGCGGSDDPGTGPSGGGGGGGGGGAAAATITITSSGVSPRDVTVPVGSRVAFVNNDTRNHEMNSNPHPSHGDCPAIDEVAFIQPGQTKLTGNLTTARVCGYHDHNQDSNTSLQGTIRIQ
jgi:plastocyanin